MSLSLALRVGFKQLHACFLFWTDWDREMPQILVDGVVPGAACFCGDGPSATADRDSSFPQCTGFLDIYSCKIVQLTQIFPGSSRGQESTQVALRSFSLEIEIHVYFLVIESGSYFLENVHRN